MTPQFLLLVIGALISALLTMILQQLSSIRSDSKESTKKLEEFMKSVEFRLSEHSGKILELRTEHDDVHKYAKYCPVVTLQQAHREA